MNRFDLLNGNINSDFTQYQCDSTSKFHNEFEAKKKKNERRERQQQLNRENKMPKLGYFSINVECASEIHIYFIHVYCGMYVYTERMNWNNSSLVFQIHLI